jgi:hypothetical protein
MCSIYLEYVELLIIVYRVERCLHSVLASRVLLHIRDYTRNKENILLQPDAITNLHFASASISGSEDSAESSAAV